MKRRVISLNLAAFALLAATAASASEWSSQNYDLYPGDFNGDGKTDVLYVAKSAGGSSGIALSNGVEWVAGAQSWNSSGFGIQWNSGAYVPVIGDFNWDGRDDIFMQRQTPGDHVLLTAQVGGTFAGVTQTIPNTRAGLILSADQHRVIAIRAKSSSPTNPKGHRLFLQAVSPGGSSAILDTGPSVLISNSIVGSAWNDGYRGFKWNLRDSMVHSGDFNGDGDGDLLIQAKPRLVLINYDVPIPVTSNRAGSYGIVYSPITSGVTDIWDRRRAGVDWASTQSNLVIGDFDGDGRDDVLVQPKRGTSSVYLVMTNSVTNLLKLSSPVTISLSGAAALNGEAYRFLVANINGGGADRISGLYLQAPASSSADLIVDSLPSGGGSMVARNQGALSQVAQQAEGPFTMAYRYNLAGQVTGIIAPDSDGNGTLKYLATRNTYDRGLLIKLESGELQSWVNDTVIPANWEQITTFTKHVIKDLTYDSYGRLTIERLSGGSGGGTQSVVQYSYDTSSRVRCVATRMNPAVFDSLPADACTAGAQGEFGQDRISRFTYDTLNQVTAEERGVGSPVLQTYVTNTYSSDLLLSQTDANGNKTELTYNNLARLEKRTFPSTTLPGALNANDYEAYTYDNNGNLLTERKRNGKIITYTYDATNRLKKKDLDNSTTSQDILFDYYASGPLRYARFVGPAGPTDTNGPGITNAVDGFGFLTSSRANTPVAATQDGPSRTVTYGYDDNGNRTRITHPDGQLLGYAYDGLNRLCGVSEGSVPTSCDTSSNSFVASVQYQRQGGRERLSRGGTTTSYTPDAIGRLSTLALDVPVSSDDLVNTFSYSPVGQITQLIQSNNQYSYVGTPGATGAYSRNGLNQVTSIAGQTINYDSNGNLTYDGTVTYSYDMENRLTGTTGAPSATSSLKYDPVGRLVQYTVNGTTTEFLYDNDSLIAEYSAGVLARRYVHGDSTSEPWIQYDGASVGASSRRYLFADHQGSIIALTDSAGSVLNKLSYDNFGLPANSNVSRFGFTGQVSLKELGLFYYRARMYSPRLGRFLQTDPVIYADHMNMYAYAANDPLNRLDPTGERNCPTEPKPTDPPCFETPESQATPGEPPPVNEDEKRMEEVVVSAQVGKKANFKDYNEDYFKVTGTDVTFTPMVKTAVTCENGKTYSTGRPGKLAPGEMGMHSHGDKNINQPSIRDDIGARGSTKRVAGVFTSTRSFTLRMFNDGTFRVRQTSGPTMVATEWAQLIADMRNWEAHNKPQPKDQTLKQTVCGP